MKTNIIQYYSAGIPFITGIVSVGYTHLIEDFKITSIKYPMHFQWIDSYGLQWAALTVKKRHRT